MELFFSVIIPLYNKEKDIAKTLESLLNQDHMNFEAIVIDDGSTDSSASIVKEFSDKRIQLYHIKNRGLPAARNLGVKYAKSEYVAFLDADDLWCNNHLSTLNELIQLYPNENWFGSSYKVLSKLGREFNSILYEKWEPNWHGLINNFFCINRTQWLVHICSICVTKTIFNQIGCFDEKLDYEEDIDFYVRLALKVPLVYANKVTLRYNAAGSNRISDSSFKGKSTFNWDKYSEYEAKNIDLKKFLDFFRYTCFSKYVLSFDTIKADLALSGINRNNLTYKQRVVIMMPRWLMVIGFKFKSALMRLGIDFHLTNKEGK
ncbi:glycosyltransferase family 2 protein [Labilibacter sediminis]|nr:glycosyltransferase family 2 protein [Labilibacter sediminis]